MEVISTLNRGKDGLVGGTIGRGESAAQSDKEKVKSIYTT